MGDLVLHPALPLATAALICLVLPTARHATAGERASRVLVVVAPALALVQLALLAPDTTVTATFQVFDIEPLRADRLALAFGWVFALAALLAGTFGLATQTARERGAALAYAAAAMGVVFAGDLLTFFVAWEIKAVASTFLILARRAPDSARAGLRYLFVHIVGGKLLLLGVLWHATDTGSLVFASFEPSPATVLILLACTVSAAVPPLHAWLPDAYPRATAAGTVLLSAYTTKAAVYALARGFSGWDVLLWVGVAMTLYGVTFAILENDIRRLLGYHIVSQVGFMVAAIGVGTQLAVNGAVAHAFAHIVYKGLLLMGTGAVLHATGRSTATQLGGLARRMRAVLALYMVGAVSISSLPLFSGYVSKELAVQGVAAAGYGAAVILLKVASVGTFLSVGLKLPYSTWFGRHGAGPTSNVGARLAVGRVPISMYVAMSGAALVSVAIGLVPSVLYGLLPFDATYDVYTTGKVVETLQLLTFTGLAFWLLRGRLEAKPGITLDTDWLYRCLPSRLARRTTRHGPTHPSDTPHAEPALASVATATGRRGPNGETSPAVATTWRDDTGRRAVSPTRIVERVTSHTRTGPPPIAATWILGAVVLVAGVVFLLLALGGGP